MLGDNDGSGWEREWSLARRAPFWEDDTREESRRRMAAAHDALVTAGSVRVDGDRIAALGYCLGGRLVLDYARGDHAISRAWQIEDSLCDCEPDL